MLLRYTTLHAAERDIRATPSRKQWWQRLLQAAPASADTIARVFRGITSDVLRDALAELAMKIKRHKALDDAKIAGLFVVAIDGHETLASYKRHCAHCSTRRVEVGVGERLEPREQYYHRVVVMSLVNCGRLRLPLDQEWVGPGEDELAAALRLLERVCKRMPRFFQVITADALYANDRFVRRARELGKDVVVCLKDNHPTAVAEVRDRMRDADGQAWQVNAKRRSMLWDFQNLLGWTPLSSCMLRVVCSRETHKRVEHTERRRVEREVEETWMLATTLPPHVAARDIARIGHARWGIENEVFNELVTHWGMNHCRHHHPNAMDAFLLTIYIAYVLFHLFLERNVKLPEKPALTLNSLADLLRESRWAPTTRKLDSS